MRKNLEEKVSLGGLNTFQKNESKSLKEYNAPYLKITEVDIENAILGASRKISIKANENVGEEQWFQDEANYGFEF